MDDEQKEQIASALNQVAHAATVDVLRCHSCGKSVSTAFFPVPTETPDGGLIVRAYIECPECINTKPDSDEIRDVRAADEALTTAVEANREQWGWAFNEMSDDQAEALNRFFNAVSKFLAAVAPPQTPEK